MSNHWFVVPAAGIGSRFGAETPKQYALIDQYSIIEHTLNQLLSWRSEVEIVVAVAADDIFWPRLAIAKDARVHCVIGGAERADSVLAALSYLADKLTPRDWVLVHDAARPCIDHDSLTRLVDSVVDDNVGGILALPVSDTLKQSVNGVNVLCTVDRSKLWSCQTPQMFRFGLLYNSLNQALLDKATITDESSAIEYSGLQPKLVEGNSCNIKVTRPEDIQLARFYIQNRGVKAQ